MKYEWRKRDQILYLPKATPCVVDVPEMTYLSLQGEGDPNGPAFQAAVKALYAFAYGVKMAPKKGLVVPHYYDYTVFPLEAFWDSKTPVIPGQVMDKQQLVYQAMLRQPEFVTADVVAKIRPMLAPKIPAELLSRITLVTFEEGLNVHMLHEGPYEDEAKSFAVMQAFCLGQGLQRIGHGHKEVYLNDPSKVSADELKTVLRVAVQPMS